MAKKRYGLGDSGRNEVETHHSERRQQTMSAPMVQLNAEIIRDHLRVAKSFSTIAAFDRVITEMGS